MYGHKGGTGKHAHPHPCSGAVACRETLRGVLGGAKPAEARTEPTGAQRGTQRRCTYHIIPAPGP